MRKRDFTREREKNRNPPRQRRQNLLFLFSVEKRRMKWWHGGRESERERERKREKLPFALRVKKEGDMKNMRSLSSLFPAAREEHALKIRWVKAPLNGRRNVQNNSKKTQLRREFLKGGAPREQRREPAFKGLIGSDIFSDWIGSFVWERGPKNSSRFDLQFYQTASHQNEISPLHGRVSCHPRPTRATPSHCTSTSHQTSTNISLRCIYTDMTGKRGRCPRF